MTQHPGPSELLSAQPAPTAIARLARRVLDVYRGADDDLRHAVHDSLQAGLPSSALLAEEEEPVEAAPPHVGPADDGRPVGAA